MVHDQGQQLGVLLLREKPVPMEVLTEEAWHGVSDGGMYYQQSADAPMMPLIAYARESVTLQPGGEVSVPIYYGGRSTLKNRAYYGKENGQGLWYSRPGEGRREYEIRYDVYAADEFAMLDHGLDCLAVGMHGCSGDMLSVEAEPIMRVRASSSGKNHVEQVIEYGTPLGIVQATCKGRPVRMVRGFGYEDPALYDPLELHKVHVASTGQSKEERYGVADASMRIVNCWMVEARQGVLLDHAAELDATVNSVEKVDGDGSKYKQYSWSQVPASWKKEIGGSFILKAPLRDLREQGVLQDRKCARRVARVLQYILASMLQGASTWDKEEDMFMAAARHAVLQELRQNKEWRAWFKRFYYFPEVEVLREEVGLLARGQQGDQESLRVLVVDEDDDCTNTVSEAGEDGELILMAAEVQRQLDMNEEEKSTIAGLMRGDAKADLSAMTEAPVSITRYLQADPSKPQSYYNEVHPTQLLDRMKPEWVQELRRVCGQDKNQTEKELEARVQRGANYLCQVRLEHWEREEDKRAIYMKIIEHQRLWNIDGNNPPLFKGPDFDYIRLKEGVGTITHQPRRVPPAALPAVYKQVKEWLQQGVIEPSSSPHNNPLVLIGKKPLPPPTDADGVPLPGYVPKKRWRICLDFTQCNASTEAVNVGGVPRVDEIIEHMCNADRHLQNSPDHRFLISALDLWSGFSQWRLSPAVRPLTAFSVPGMAHTAAHCQFTRLPFGLAPSPGRFSDIVGDALGSARFGNPSGSQKVLDGLATFKGGR